MESLECEVCLQNFDEDKRLPRCLTCGHTLCTSCLCHLLAQRASLKCPFCRALHMVSVSLPKEIPVNYSILKVMAKGNHATNPSEAISQNIPDEVFQFIKYEACENTEGVYRDFEAVMYRLLRYQKYMDIEECMNDQIKAKTPNYSKYLKDFGDEMKVLKKTTNELIMKGTVCLKKLRACQKLLKKSKTVYELANVHTSIICCYEVEMELREHEKLLAKFKRVEKATPTTLLLAPTEQQTVHVKGGLGGVAILLYVLVFIIFILTFYMKS